VQAREFLANLSIKQARHWSTFHEHQIASVDERSQPVVEPLQTVVIPEQARLPPEQLHRGKPLRAGAGSTEGRQ